MLCNCVVPGKVSQSYLSHRDAIKLKLKMRIITHD